MRIAAAYSGEFAFANSRPARGSGGGGRINVSNSRIEAFARSRALVLRICCNEPPTTGRPFGIPVFVAVLRPFFFFAGRRGRAASYVPPRNRAELEKKGPSLAQTSAVRMQITALRCNHASIWWSTIIRTISLHRLVNRRILRVLSRSLNLPIVRSCFPKISRPPRRLQRRHATTIRTY